MKSTKTLFLTALAVGSLLVFGTGVRAGDTTNNPPSTPPAGGPPPGGPPGGPGMRGRPGMAMLERLNLTDDQKPKVEAIMKTQREKIRDVMQDTSLSPEDRMAKTKAIHEDATSQMKAVLTAEQFQKWQDMQSKMRNRRMGPPPGAENGPPPARENAGTNAPAPPPPEK